MRRETTFGELPGGAAFLWGHGVPSDFAGSGCVKVGPSAWRHSQSDTIHRTTKKNANVTWLDAPDDYVLEPDTPDAADAQALEQLAAEEPGLRAVIWPSEPGPTAPNPFFPGMSLLVKLGSIAVHAEEAMSDKAHQFDMIAMNQILNDPEVKEWLAQMNALAMLPVKR